MEMFVQKEVRMVDALDDGRIVRVPEAYALREGLAILRRIPSSEDMRVNTSRARKIDEVKLAPFETLRRPLPNKRDEVTASLVDNFHWIFARKRRERSLSRKHVAEAIGVTENDIKLIENGVLPSNDFVLVSKIEQFYGIVVRKEGSTVAAPDTASLRPASAVISEAREEELLGAEDLFADSVEDAKVL